MPLPANATARDYIHDFAKSKAPQFKGKTKEKRRKMAVAAFLQSKDKVMKEEFKVGDQVEWKTKTMFGPNKRTGTVTHIHPDNHYTVDTSSPWKKTKSFPSKVHGDQLTKKQSVAEQQVFEFFTEAFNTDDHLHKMNAAFDNYQKATKLKNKELQKIHAREYYKHREALEKLNDYGNYKKS